MNTTLMKYALVISLCMVNPACGGETPNAKKDAPAPAPELKKAANPAADVANPTETAARAILDRLQSAGENYTTLRAEVEYEVVNRMTGEKEQRDGWVAYQKETKGQPAKFRVHFDTLRLEDGPKTKNVVDYIFDGRFVTRDNYKTKTRTRWQVAAKTERVEALKIGKGPFPVPFGQKTSDVLTYLQGKTRKPQAEDPRDTEYLRLFPLPGKEKDVNFKRLEMWVARKTLLPVQIRVRDANKSVKTVVFKETKTNPNIDEKLFNVRKPVGFELIVQRLEK